MQSSESIPAVRNEKIHAAFLRSKFKNHSQTVQRILAQFSDAELLAEHTSHQQYRAGLSDRILDRCCGLKQHAYKDAVTATLTDHPELVESLDASVALHRQSAVLRAKTHQKYALILETYLRKFPSNPRQKNPVLEDLRELANL